jgi:hypothetical protein
MLRMTDKGTSRDLTTQGVMNNGKIWERRMFGWRQDPLFTKVAGAFDKQVDEGSFKSDGSLPRHVVSLSHQVFSQSWRPMNGTATLGANQDLELGEVDD